MSGPEIVRSGAYREEVPALTGLRFIAAFSVLLSHSIVWILPSHTTPYGALYWLSQASGFGMTLFFVLSGFVIHYNYAGLVTDGRLPGIGLFLWARFARLYPLFLLMMLVYVLVSSRNIDFWTGHPERFNSTLQALPYFLPSIQSWVYTIIDGNPLIDAIGGGSPVTWSISTEWFFYFVFPCVAWLLLRVRSPQITAVLAILWCVLWSSISIGLNHRSPQIDAWAIAHFGPLAGLQEHQQSSFVRWLLYISPYLRIGEFILGNIFAHLYIRLRNRPVAAWENSLGTAAFVAAATSVFLITYLEYSPNVGDNIFRPMNMNFALAPSAALLTFCAARYRSGLLRILTLRPMLALGEASYSIYLVHVIVLTAAVKLTGSATHSFAYDAAKSLILVTIICVVSVMLFTYYEAPARRWLRRRWVNRRMHAALATPLQTPAS